jgi:hypothetical protein
MRRISEEMQPGECCDWKAWYTNLSDDIGILHVTGRCKFPTDGFSVTLRAKPLQGINPGIYLLERYIIRPMGRIDRVETVVEVRYFEYTSFVYDFVHILPDGIDVKIGRAD